MIISQTPLRISFAGGGTDLKEYYTISNGAVLSTAIDKYVYVIVKERFDNLIYINYSKKEIVDSVRKIEHDLVREALIKTGIKCGIEITTLADIPSEGSGLGSSSSITVGLLNALYSYKGELVTAERLAQDACEIEIDLCGRPIGKQDQYIAAYGGMREIVFHPDESVSVNRVKLENGARRVLGSNLLLFYTNITRKSSSILSEQKKVTKNKYEILTTMRNQVQNLKNTIEHNTSYDEVGYILDKAWKLKKQISGRISNQKIDEMYVVAKEAGALGGKISGAGGGGFLLVYVPREKQNRVREALKKYREFPFMLEQDGSKIIFNLRREYWK